jgi:acetyl-CoA C-acetyltransferase
MNEAWIIDACRTPRGIGKQGKGALADMHPQHLGATVLKALAERTGINTAEVDDIIWGTSTQKGTQGADLGRMAALDAGYSERSSAVTLDRFCGSGITTVNIAAASILSGMEDLVIAGGTEMMSMTATLRDGPGPAGQRQPAPARTPPATAPGHLRRRDRHAGGHRPRRRSTRWRWKVQRRAAVAIAEGRFSKSLDPGLQGRRHTGAGP